MLMTALLNALAWLEGLHPRRRRALAKRRLEAACRAHGCSKSQATAIAGEFFR